MATAKNEATTNGTNADQTNCSVLQEVEQLTTSVQKGLEDWRRSMGTTWTDRTGVSNKSHQTKK